MNDPDPKPFTGPKGPSDDMPDGQVIEQGNPTPAQNEGDPGDDSGGDSDNEGSESDGK